MGVIGKRCISIISLLVFGIAQASALSSTEYYESSIKAPSIGNYEFKVETHEVPSKEYLPIVDKSYFPSTVVSLFTEVDNLPPSATYDAKTLSLVDVVFAFGEMSQAQTMQDNMDRFESMLGAAGNNIDAYVEKVETSTIDVTSQDPSQILGKWEAWKQYPGDPTTSWSYVQSDNSIQDNEYHCHRQGFVDRSVELDSDFILEADIVGYNHSWNDFYGLTFRHQEGGGHYAVVWQDVRGSGCGMYNGQLDTGLSLVKTSSISNNGRMDDGVTLAKLNIGSWSEGQYWNLKIEMKGNTIIVYINGVEILRYTDSNPYKDGNYGIVSVSHGKGRFKNIKVITGSRKSLGEAITDVAWRDNSTRFVVYGEDTVPEYMVNKNNVDYQYTVAKLLNSNAYLINLGKNGVNNVVLNELIKDISTATETKGTFINNTPIISAMDSACNWIINLVKNRYKPTGWILVNEPVVWLTKYNDSEHDVPLNFGEHDGNDKFNDSADITISNAWGIGLTNLFTQDKIMAEKWRFRHNWTYYDNPTYEETFHDIWISDPVDIFPNPGLYRINYKRKDNPFYSDVLLTNPFDEYRYWSEDYDPVVSK